MPGTTDRDVIVPSDILTAVSREESLALADLARGKTVLEMGAFYGHSTVVLASVADLVVSVDWHQGDSHAGDYRTEDEYRRNLTRYGVANRVLAVTARFEDVLPKLGKSQFDGLFLDAHHTAESVSADLDLALPLLERGAFVAFHDYGRGPATGHPDFDVTSVADKRVGITGQAGHLGWGFLPE